MLRFGVSPFPLSKAVELIRLCCHTSAISCCSWASEMPLLPYAGPSLLPAAHSTQASRLSCASGSAAVGVDTRPYCPIATRPCLMAQCFHPVRTSDHHQSVAGVYSTHWIVKTLATPCPPCHQRTRQPTRKHLLAGASKGAPCCLSVFNTYVAGWKSP